MNELDTEMRELARQLGELRLLWLDMGYARSLFERLAEMPDGFGDFRLASALWTSGLVAYRRCFTSGQGNSSEHPRGLILHDLVDSLEIEQRGLHDDALVMAERHVVPRAADQHEVEVWLEFEQGPPPRALTVRTRQIMPVARTHNAFDFATLTKYLADRLETKCLEMETEIVALANASDAARWMRPTGESPEWVNILSDATGSIPTDTPTTTRDARRSSGPHTRDG
jgi:hypothetical protein